MSKNVDVEFEFSEKTVGQLHTLANKYYNGDINVCVTEIAQWYIQYLKDKGIVREENGELKKVLN